MTGAVLRLSRNRRYCWCGAQFGGQRGCSAGGFRYVCDAICCWLRPQQHRPLAGPNDRRFDQPALLAPTKHAPQQGHMRREWLAVVLDPETIQQRADSGGLRRQLCARRASSPKDPRIVEMPYVVERPFEYRRFAALEARRKLGDTVSRERSDECKRLVDVCRRNGPCSCCDTRKISRDLAQAFPHRRCWPQRNEHPSRLARILHRGPHG
jgi:hypothetical protein